MDNWEFILREARDCHTKIAWESFCHKHADAISSANSSRPIAEIYRCLSSDPQSSKYNPKIWGALLRGTLSSWNLELGRKIAEHVRKVPSPAIMIPSAQVYLDSGMCSETREIANRALRLSGLSASEKLQLDLIVCNSYAWENKHTMAKRILARTQEDVLDMDLEPRERAEFLNQMARMHFLMGQFRLASELFHEAYKIYLNLGEWEQAARCIYNTAANMMNSGSHDRDRAFSMIEECRRLSEEHDLKGPLAHCEAAYGMDAYHHGDYADAREHFRRALEHIPFSDKGQRRLHILSMLAYTYFAMGRFHLARKFSQQTLDLAALADSTRFDPRYTTLEAEMLWQDGQIVESQKLLASIVDELESRGLETLEEMATLSRYNYQSSLLFQRRMNLKTKIKDELRSNLHNWLERQFTLGQLLINRYEHNEAEACFDECLSIGRNERDRWSIAMGLLGKIQLRLMQRRVDDTDELTRDFEIAAGRLGDTPVKVQVQVVHAARAYQHGDFQECERILRLASKSTRQTFHDRFVISCFMATIEGRSTRLNAEWQQLMVSRFARVYFAPSLEALDPRNFQVSGKYLVSLERHPSLGDLLHFLMMRSNYSATPSDIQSEVWRQSLNSQGWQQKIRNSVMRIRDFFPYTMAPIIIHSDSVSLFKEAIQVSPSRREGLANREEVLRLLSDTAMSSSELSRRLKLSPATVKRILKKLGEAESIQQVKQGRNVVYEVRP